MKLSLVLSILLLFATNAWAETESDYLHCVYENQSPTKYEKTIEIQNKKAIETQLSLEKLRDDDFLIYPIVYTSLRRTFDFIYMSDGSSFGLRLNRKTLDVVSCYDSNCRFSPCKCEIVSKEKYNKIRENHSNKIKAHVKERTKKNKL